MDDLNDQRQQRIKKLDALRELGVAPYGARFEVKDRAGRLTHLHGAKSKETLEQEKISCTLAGRIVGLRRFGKAAFAVLQDGSDRLQVYLKKDILGDRAYHICEALDIGDWIGVTGVLFRKVLVQLGEQLHRLQRQFGADQGRGVAWRRDQRASLGRSALPHRKRARFTSRDRARAQLLIESNEARRQTLP